MALTARRVGTLSVRHGDVTQEVCATNAGGENERGDALHRLSIVGGNFQGGLDVENAGRVGTISVRAHRNDGRGRIETTPLQILGDLRRLKADHLAADLTVGGRAASVRTYGDNIADEAAAPLATITTAGKATVRGKNQVIRIGDEGGQVYIIE